MILTLKNGLYVAMTRFEEKDIPKNAGFKWEPIERYWYTKDPVVASKLYGYGDSSCRSELEAMSKKYDGNIAQSKAREANITIPANPGCVYREFQKAGIKFATEREATFIADDMGIGKTIQAIGVMNMKQSQVGNAIIVCPNTVKIGWRDHLSMWLVNKRLTVDIASPKGFPQSDIVIINYELLKKFSRAIKVRTWDLAILDEAHLIKNPKAQRTQEIIGKIVKKQLITSPLKAKIRLALSGTPLLNRTIELWPILNWLDPTTYDSFFKFGIRYANGHKGRFGWDFSGYSNLQELQRKLRSTVMIRRTKAEVLTELPPKIRQVIEMPLSNADSTVASVLHEREVIDSWVTRLSSLKLAVELAKISDNKEEYFDALSKLKEAQGVAFNEMAKVRHETALKKLPLVLEHIKNVLESTEGKLAIFGYHHDMINGLAKEIPNCAILTGEHNVDEKNAAVVKFVKDPACRVFLGSIKAAGLGLNDLQLVCSHGIFVEEDWVPSVITQCEDRLHRMGQLYSVLIQHMVLEGSMDALMAKKIIHKQGIADRTLDIGLESGQALDLNDIVSTQVDTTEDFVTPDQITIDAGKLTNQQILDIHNALKLISGMCDMATTKDYKGFNRFDAYLGNNLAAHGRLTPKAAALGRKLALKYKKQLQPSVYQSFEEL